MWYRNGLYAGSAGAAPKISYIGNVCERVNGHYFYNAGAPQDYAGLIASGTLATMKIYVSDNACQRKRDGYTDAQCISDLSSNWTPETTSPIDVSDYPILASGSVQASVLADVGNKFKDDHDNRILSQVGSNTAVKCLYPVPYVINSPQALPARTINRTANSNGNVSSGKDFSAGGPYTFDILVNGTGVQDALASNCSNTDYTTFSDATATGFHAESDGTGGHNCKTANELNITSGMTYKVTFTMNLISGRGPQCWLTGGTEADIIVESVNNYFAVHGANVFYMTSDTTDATSAL